MSRLLQCSRALLVAALLAALAPPALSQQKELDKLAARFAEQLSKPEWKLTGEVRTVVVAFSDSAGGDPQLGARLASLFVEALRRQGINLAVVDTQTYARYLKQRKATSGKQPVPNVALDSPPTLQIFGFYDRWSRRVALRVRAALLATNRVIAEAHTDIPLTDDLLKPVDIPVVNSPSTAIPSTPPANDVPQTVYNAGKDGITFPKCIACPDPKFTDEARAAKYFGTVLLRITVSPDGTVGDIQILKDRPYGLTEAAMNAVRRWKFEPARNREGQPVTVQVLVEVSFKLK
jgi:TonB family protein